MHEMLLNIKVVYF